MVTRVKMLVVEREGCSGVGLSRARCLRPLIETSITLNFDKQCPRAEVLHNKIIG